MLRLEGTSDIFASCGTQSEDRAFAEALAAKLIVQNGHRLTYDWREVRCRDCSEVVNVSKRQAGLFITGQALSERCEA